MGDLNLNPLNEHDKMLIKLCCGQSKYPILKEPTTNWKNQLDHILIERSLQNTSFATSFTNFMSDHKTIVVRIGAEGNCLKQQEFRQPRISNKLVTSNENPSVGNVRKRST